MPARRMRKRAPRRRMRKLRVPRNTGIRGLTKTYSYLFKPDPQYLRSNTVAGEIVQSLTQPLANASISSINPSVLGLPNYYDFGVGLSFRVGDLMNINNFLAIYDEYKITNLKCRLTFLSGQAQIGGLSLLPTMNYVADQDNSIAPTSAHDVVGKQGSRALRVSNARNTFSLSIKPMVNHYVAANTGSGQFAALKASPWLDCAHPDILHNAGKFWFQNIYLPAGSSTNTAIQWEFTFNVSFKGAQNLY